MPISDILAGFGIGIGIGKAIASIVAYWSWHTHRFEKTIGAPLACTITHDGLLKELNREVGALCVLFHYMGNLGKLL